MGPRPKPWTPNNKQMPWRKTSPNRKQVELKCLSICNLPLKRDVSLKPAFQPPARKWSRGPSTHYGWSKQHAIWIHRRHPEPQWITALPRHSDYRIPNPRSNHERNVSTHFLAITLKKKKKMLFAPMDFQELTLDALIVSGALANCLSDTDYNKILQMSPRTNSERWNHPRSKSKSRTVTLKPPPRPYNSNSKSHIGFLRRH